MLIPLGTDRPIRRPSVVTPALILLCAIVFVIQLLARSNQTENELLARFWVTGDGFALYRTITYAFLHGDLIHLGGNMLFLWVFGRPVEDRMGRVGFGLFYLGGAMAGGLVHAWLEPGPAIGASGAVSAVTGAFLVLFPRTKIRVLWFFFLITMMMAPAWFFIGLQIAWNVMAEASGSAGNVAVRAHLAGYAFGFGTAMALLAIGVLPREHCDLFYLSKHAKRRRDFRAAAKIAEPRPLKNISRGPALSERTEAVANDRAAVSEALSRGDLSTAVDAYRTLIERHADSRENVTLSRNAQYQLGTHLATIGDTPLTIRAFDDFLAAYPKDPESVQIRILLARFCASIGATERARRLLAEAIETARNESVRSLAKSELAALGAPEDNAGTPTTGHK